MRRCYYCGATAKSDEHAPPRQMFKGFPGHKIKVPSCEVHNNHKSQDDTAILRAMLISLDNVSKLGNIDPDVQIAVQYAKPYFYEVKKLVGANVILDQPPDQLDIPLAHLSPSIDIFEWMRQLTGALIYHVTKAYDDDVDWRRAGVWSPDWLPNAQPVSKSNDEIMDWALEGRQMESDLQQLRWSRGWWSEGPKSYPAVIFRFDVHLNSRLSILRLVFFSAYRWYVSFCPSAAMLEKLSRAIQGN